MPRRYGSAHSFASAEVPHSPILSIEVIALHIANGKLQIAKQSANSLDVFLQKSISSQKLAEVARAGRNRAKLGDLGSVIRWPILFFPKFEPTGPTPKFQPRGIALKSSQSSLFRVRIDHSAIELSCLHYSFWPHPCLMLDACALNIFIIKLSSGNQITSTTAVDGRRLPHLAAVA